MPPKTNSLSYKFARIFWSIYFVLSIGIVGIICGYFLTFLVYFMAWLLRPWPRASENTRHLAEDIQCLSIRFLLKIQPWLRCETNFHEILGFYQKFSSRRIVFMANHRSNFDTFLLISYIPGLRGLAKSSLFHNLFFAPFMWVMGFIPVDKGSPVSFLKGLKTMEEKILKKDHAVLIFPENSRCEKNFKSVNKFSGAFFSMAMDCDAIIVPLVIEDTDQILGRGDFWLSPYQPVKIRMLAPVNAGQFSDFMVLRDSIWNQIKLALP